VARLGVLEKLRGERHRPVEVGIPGQLQRALRLLPLALTSVEGRQLVMDLLQPTWPGRLIGVCDTPVQVFEGGLLPVEEARKLRVDDSGHPSHDEDFSIRSALGPLENVDRLPNPADPFEKRNIAGVTRPQKSDRREVEGSLTVGEL